MSQRASPFGVHITDPIYDIYTSARLLKRSVRSIRWFVALANVQPVGRAGRRHLYRQSQVVEAIERHSRRRKTAAVNVPPRR